MIDMLRNLPVHTDLHILLAGDQEPRECEFGGVDEHGIMYRDHPEGPWHWSPWASVTQVTALPAPATPERAERLALPA